MSHDLAGDPIGEASQVSHYVARKAKVYILHKQDFSGTILCNFVIVSAIVTNYRPGVMYTSLQACMQRPVHMSYGRVFICLDG